eukprot:10808361-Lingulodinium_polyedra.AAC.1
MSSGKSEGDAARLLPGASPTSPFLGMARCWAQAFRRPVPGPSSAAEVLARMRRSCATATGRCPLLPWLGHWRPAGGPDGSARMPGGC